MDYLLLCLLSLSLILPTKSLPFERGNSKQKYSQRGIQQTTTEDHDLIWDPDVFVRKSLKYTTRSYSAVGKGLKCTHDICDDAKDYPYERLRELNNQSLLTIYKLSGFMQGNVEDIGTRFNSGVEEESDTLCKTHIYTTYPKVLKNEKKMDKFIVNVDDHRQGIAYETCLENAQCADYVILSEKHSPECSQRYTRIRLLVLEDDGNPTYDFFIVPSCCVCTITKNE